MDEIRASAALSPSLPADTSHVRQNIRGSQSPSALPPLSFPQDMSGQPSPNSACSPPSSPLSELCKTPSLPCSPELYPTIPPLDHSERYPSPSASQSSDGSPRKMDRDSDIDRDGHPSAKRRRVQAPPKRPRMTRHLDLTEMSGSDGCETELSYLLHALRTKKRIVIIAGAGISVSAGIPDFRSSTGLFTTLRGQHGSRGSGKHLFDASVYKHDSSTTSFHSMVRELAHMTQAAKPTPFHHMLASIASEGRLMRLYSQNVDCIDTNLPPLATNVPLNAKGPWPTTVQLHGGLAKMVCSKCGQLEDFNASLFDGPEPPPCEPCTAMDEVRTAVAGKRSHGIGRLRPRIVLYNEYNPDEEAIGNVSKADLRRGADAVIVVGTSLKIPGVRRLVKELCHTTRSRRDGFTAWLNLDPEPQGAEFKDCWDLVVRGSSDDVARLAGLPRWDEPNVDNSSDWLVTGKENLGLEKLQVVLESSAPPKSHVANMDKNQPAPAASGRKPLPNAKTLQTPTKNTPGTTPSKASIPTPGATPSNKRKRLPDTKQGKLLFPLGKADTRHQTAPAKIGTAQPNSSASDKVSTTAKKAPAAIVVGKLNKAALSKVKAKKEERLSANSLSKVFRATKNVATDAVGAKKRKPLPSGRPPTGGDGCRVAGERWPKKHSTADASIISIGSGTVDLSPPTDSVKQRRLSDFKLPTLRGDVNNSSKSPGMRSMLSGKENQQGGDASGKASTHAICVPLRAVPPTPGLGCLPSGTDTVSPGSITRGMSLLVD